ncbi:serine/threonine-protein kinase [Symmachiella dynata]|uniref:serine/threonine protein kinase n=1 Tax=Symmachiella dynata TaxID=2527995 RepID=UPI0030EF0AE8
MRTVACPDGTRLLDYVLGRLDEEQIDVVADHIDHCEQCEAMAKELDSTSDSLVALLRTSNATDPNDEDSEIQLAIQAVVSRTLRKTMSNWTAARLPEQFGRYRIIDQLGSGGMGSVFLAWDNELDRKVALKIPHFFVQDHVKVRERFMREAKLAAQIAHSHICRVYDVGELDGLCFLAMEYIEGLTLEASIEKEAMPMVEAVRIVRIVAETMQQLHDSRIVHRDLKPGNVIVRADGEPVIMDFGLARAFDNPLAESRITIDGMLVGSPAYMSPEQVAGDKDGVLPASDIYSLGAILFELLTRTIPFEGNVAQVLASVLNDLPPVPSSRCADIPPALDRICLKAIQKKGEDRFASMSEFAQALAAFEKGEDSLLKSLCREPVTHAADEATDVISAAAEKQAPLQLAGGTSNRRKTSKSDSRFPGSAMFVVGVVGLLILPAVSLFAIWWFPEDSNAASRQTEVPSLPVGEIQFQIDHPEDTALSLYVDGLPVDIQGLAKGAITLPVGSHQYEVQRDGFSIDANEFHVNPGVANKPLKILTRWTKKSGS